MKPDANTKRWAVARVVLGTLQVVGAMTSVLLLIQTGTSRLTVGTTVVTGVFMLASVFLFQIRRYGQ